MKSKLARRLLAYFAAALLLFSAFIGIAFQMLFTGYTTEINKQELGKRAIAMADTLSSYAGNGGTSGGAMGGMMGGYGAYIRFLNEIAMADVWIVDENLELLTSGRMMGAQPTYRDLPSDAEDVVAAVFQGQVTFSEGFSSLLDAPALTVGAPIRAGDRVVGALLLHDALSGQQEAVAQGERILLISLGAALLLAVIPAFLLSLKFVGPLRRMKEAALHLSLGGYGEKTGIRQGDEIGELAQTMDVLSDRLLDAKREGEKLEKMRQDFVASISHELRTPVTVLRGSLEALSDGVVTGKEQVEEYHRSMLREAVSLSRLVDDLMDLNRLQNMDFPMEVSTLSLGEVLDDAVHSARQLAREKQMEISLQKTEEPVAVAGDYGRLRQMFLILLDNAVKYSLPGSRVTVTLTGVDVTVVDEGPGILAAELPYVFDRFFRGGKEKNGPGSGLGLSIAKQIALRHGGELSLFSDGEKGTRVVFTFRGISPAE